MEAGHNGHGADYGKVYGADPVDLPAYTIADAARFIRLPYSTLKFWVRGGDYNTQEGPQHADPVIPMADAHHLSFRELVEAHVLKALRRRHNIPLPEIRETLTYIQEAHDIARPLSHSGLRAAMGRILLEKYGELIDSKPEGQMVLRAVFDAYVDRLEWDRHGAIRRLFPFVRQRAGKPSPDEPKIVIIDPRFGFGRPIVGPGIRTSIIIERFEAGESLHELANDFACDSRDVEEAIRYENAVRGYEEAAA